MDPIDRQKLLFAVVAEYTVDSSIAPAKIAAAAAAVAHYLLVLGREVELMV